MAELPPQRPKRPHKHPHQPQHPLNRGTGRPGPSPKPRRKKPSPGGRFFRLGYLLSGVVLAIFIGVIIWGTFLPHTHEIRTETTLDTSPQELVDLLHHLPKIHDTFLAEVDRAVVLSNPDDKELLWEEHLQAGGTQRLKGETGKNSNSWVVTLQESSYGMAGTWHFTWEPLEGEGNPFEDEPQPKTRLTVTQALSNEDILVRATMAMAGHQDRIQREVEAIREGLRDPELWQGSDSAATDELSTPEPSH